MPNKLDLTGRRFGRLVAIRPTEERRGNGEVVWQCKCDCGNMYKVTTGSLKSGHTKSCGCLQLSKGGESSTRIGYLYNAMKNRCHNSNNRSYSNYGGRGITVCAEWRNNFEAFRDWANTNGYGDNLSIDRIDNEKGYSPDNCRWVTAIEQANNTRKNINVEINGKTLSLSQWSKISGLDSATIRLRYIKGIRSSDLIAPINLIKIKINGENHTLFEWEKITGIKKATLWARYNKGICGTELISPLKKNKNQILK